MNSSYLCSISIVHIIVYSLFIFIPKIYSIGTYFEPQPIIIWKPFVSELKYKNEYKDNQDCSYNIYKAGFLKFCQVSLSTNNLK